MPVIGWLDHGTGQPNSNAAFRNALSGMGYVEGRNLAIEYLSTAQYNQARALTAELARRGVTVIFTETANATQAAKAATTTIPIVFAIGPDPVQIGLVASYNRPGGNATGMTTYSAELGAKRLELLRELVPQAIVLGFLTNPSNLISEGDTANIQTAARSIGQQMLILRASTADEIDAAFATLVRERAGGLVVDADGLLFNQRAAQFAVLAARSGIPVTYATRLFPEAGGLMSYGDDRLETWRQAGLYIGRILKGDRPADLPVLQPTKFEFVINLRKKALGIEFPPSFHLRATEAVE